MTAQPDYDIDLKLAELKINGYVTFEDLIPVEKIGYTKHFCPCWNR